MDGKPFYLSKTFWFNVLAIVVAIAAAFGFNEFELDPELAEYAAIAIAVVNLILRLVTKEPVVLARREPVVRQHRR